MSAATETAGWQEARLLSRDEYEALVGRGVLAHARVELLDGEIVSMPPIKEPHNFGVTALTEQLVLALHGRAKIRTQCSFRVPGDSEPEPDIAVVSTDLHLEHPPEAAYLIVEVADSSVGYDRKKANGYAAAGVPEYWIVNIVAHCIEVHRLPQGVRYESVVTYRPGERIALVAFPDVSIATSDVLPPAR